MTGRHTLGRARALFACALLLSLAACGGSGEQPAAKTEGGANAPANNAASPPGDLSQLGGDIERLEKQTERYPGDDEARDRLASAYVQRANALRQSQQLREALADYQRALRINPDNEEAKKNAAEVSVLVEGTPKEGEYGEPPPLPITPNVTGGEASPAATPTPKKQ
jgi:tetratricopeptide (TPR) repeat protein